MTVYEITNIENCTIESVASGRMFRITSNEGWYIHLNDGDEFSENVYKTVVILPATYPFEQVQIIPESELPEDAEILGGNTDPETETI